MKKKHNASKVINELEGSSFFKKAVDPVGHAEVDTGTDPQNDTSVDTRTDAKIDTQTDTVIDTHSDTQIDTLNDTPRDAHSDTDKDAHQRERVETHASTHHLPTPDAVDEMVFRYRKLSKVRANADMPEAWKDELDEYAHQHKLGKYHLVMYAVAKMLGKI